MENSRNEVLSRVAFIWKRDVLELHSCGILIPVSLRCPRFMINGQSYGGSLVPTGIQGDIENGGQVVVLFQRIISPGNPEIDVKLYLQWSAAEQVLRKWASCRVYDASDSNVIEEVILEELDTSVYMLESFTTMPSWFHEKIIQSFPAFFKGFFAGVEFPIASSRVEEGVLYLGHRPGIRCRQEQWYETRKAVYGLAEPGKEREAFCRYLQRHSISPSGFHVNYNSWWTSPVPYTEKDILDIMGTLKENLYDKHGVSMDTFSIDMGWSNPCTLWEINTGLFPEGFRRLNERSASMNCSLGLWISPSSCYHPHAVDNNWAEEMGYETAEVPWVNNTVMKFACLAGDKYWSSFHESLLKLVKEYGLKHVKLDGLFLECPAEGHGHEPGILSSEAIAENAIRTFDALHEADTDIWLEATCFGWNPSPWWLFHVNSVLGAYGDDAPFGRVPCPIYRESYTTSRDYFNLQGADRIPVPVKAQELLGVIHQTQDMFLNDMVVTVLRGHAFMPLYINPAFMNEARWKMLADVLRWARSNACILENTTSLLPLSWIEGTRPAFSNDGVMPREPYGYAHWKNNGGTVLLRNPWIKPCKYSLKLPEDINDSSVSNQVDVVGIYPELRLYGKGYKAGDILDIPLAPYETIVLSVGPDTLLKERQLPAVFENAYQVNYQVLEYQAGPEDIQLAAGIDIQAPFAEILILLEGNNPLSPPVYTTTLNGRETAAVMEDSEKGWAASVVPAKEYWKFLRIAVKGGEHHFQLKLQNESQYTDVSVWVWTYKKGTSAVTDNDHMLPQPEIISLGASALMEYHRGENISL